VAAVKPLPVDLASFYGVAPNSVIAHPEIGEATNVAEHLTREREIDQGVLACTFLLRVEVADA
jgi:hypothetical protein